TSTFTSAYHLLFFFPSSSPDPHLHSFPTRRSSDLKNTRSVRHRHGRKRSTTPLQKLWLSRIVLQNPVGVQNLPKNCICFRFISRSEEHTSELQSRFDLVCRLLLEKKNNEESYIWYV